MIAAVKFVCYWLIWIVAIAAFAGLLALLGRSVAHGLEAHPKLTVIALIMAAAFVATLFTKD